MKKKVRCGWCQGTFEMETERDKHGYGTHGCLICGRIVRSSRKEVIEGIFPKGKHIHSELREGDIV